MTENSIPGPMTMIKIDGAKIKGIREAQGLTQLYVATSVQVTTDTISRWENRRYPTIKKENGLKLAEALGVPLDDILEQESEKKACIGDAPSRLSLPAEQPPTPPRYGFKKIWPLLLLSGFLLATILTFLFYFLYSGEGETFSVKRVVPSHIVAGMPFPVIIYVSGRPDSSTSLIIRETLPKGITLLSTSPRSSTTDEETNEIKWLKKVTGTTAFAYLVKGEGDDKETVVFDGTVAIGRNSSAPSSIDGDRNTKIGVHHWADTDKDNSISDNEVLMVYEQYSDIENLDMDIDLIEEIWLGTGYSWDPATSSFEIVD